MAQEHKRSGFAALPIFLSEAVLRRNIGTQAKPKNLQQRFRFKTQANKFEIFWISNKHCCAFVFTSQRVAFESCAYTSIARTGKRSLHKQNRKMLSISKVYSFGFFLS